MKRDAVVPTFRVRGWMVALALLVSALPTLQASTNGSVWKSKNTHSSMFSDRKAIAVGDLVTVIVQESATVSNAKRSSTERSTATQDQLSRLLYSAAAFATEGGSAPLSKGGELPGLGWSTSNSFEGSGATSGQSSVQSRLSVVVIDRLPNGNLVIEGLRKLEFAEEKNYMVLRGLIRPTDVAADNTILSSRIADAEIQLVAEGTLSESQRKGWLSRLYSWINPF